MALNVVKGVLAIPAATGNQTIDTTGRQAAFAATASMGLAFHLTELGVDRLIVIPPPGTPLEGVEPVQHREQVG